MKEEQQVLQAPFKFKSFLIAESSIKIEPGTEAPSIDISFDPKGVILETEKIFEIQLGINIKSEDGLKISVKMVGIFEFKDVVKTENLSTYFYVNAPAIIFPYIRSYISALTALSGIKTIIIPPMNMSTLGKKLEENTTFKKEATQ